MTTVRVPPGRAGRLWLRRRLAVARRGSDLLERKLRILLADRERLREREQQTGQTWRDRIADAETWLLRAALISGERALRLAEVPGLASVTITWTSAMGVRYPADAACQTPRRTPLDPAPGGAAVVRAQQEYARATEAAAQHAVARTAIDRVDTEIVATRQRVRALQRRWIPPWKPPSPEPSSNSRNRNSPKASAGSARCRHRTDVDVVAGADDRPGAWPAAGVPGRDPNVHRHRGSVLARRQLPTGTRWRVATISVSTTHCRGETAREQGR